MKVLRFLLGMVVGIVVWYILMNTPLGVINGSAVGLGVMLGLPLVGGVIAISIKAKDKGDNKANKDK